VVNTYSYLRKKLERDDPKARTCQTCGMLLDHAAELHPYVFCVLKKAGRDPWADFKSVAEMLGFAPLPAKPPLVRNLPL
jgi:hypothetical protein